jgi:hypothetical protein
MRSPMTNSRLPGSTRLRRPPGPWWKMGSDRSLDGMEIFSPRSRSVTLRPDTTSAAALRICALKRRRKRWRLTALRFLPERRRSTSRFMARSRSGRLSRAQIPLGQQAHLLVGVALGTMRWTKSWCFFCSSLEALALKRSPAAGPRCWRTCASRSPRAASRSWSRPGSCRGSGAGAQHEVDHLVAEVLRVAMPAGFSIFSSSVLSCARSRISPVSGSRNSWSWIHMSA